MKNWMEDSTFYQMLIRNGEVKGCRETLRRAGRKKFSPPSPEVEAALNGIAEVARLEALADRLFDVSSWDELLATP